MDFKELTTDVIYKIFENYSYLSIEEKVILKLYFKDDLIDIIKNNFTEIEFMREREGESDENNINDIINCFKKNHFNKLLGLFPDINYLLNSNLNKYKSIDLPINSNLLYEYGYQMKENTNKFYYIRFYEWATYDIDNINYEKINELLLNLSKNLNMYIFSLYKTNKGYHVHIMNKPILYNSIEYKILSKILKNDIFYYLFTQNNGYKLRLSKKTDNDNIAKFLKYYYPENKDIKICAECHNYEKIYNNYLKIFNH